jgi:hypothetical protein
MLITYWLIAPITLSFFVNIVTKYNLNISLTFERERTVPMNIVRSLLNKAFYKQLVGIAVVIGAVTPTSSLAIEACYTNINLSGATVAAANAAACTAAGTAAGETYYWADPFAGVDAGVDTDTAMAWSGEDLELTTQALEIEMPQRIILTDNLIAAPAVAFDGVAKDIAKWQVWSNGSFTAKIASTFPPDAAGVIQTAAQLGYTPPAYPAFTKQDLNAAGVGVANEFDELPATFSIMFNNIDSIATVGIDAAATKTLAVEGGVLNIATAGLATWGPKIGSLMETDMGGGVNVQVQDGVTEADGTVTWVPPEIVMQATVPVMTNAWSVQPGTYKAAIQLTVIATQPTATQVAAAAGGG